MRRRLLDQAAGVHHQNLVSHFRDDAQVVSVKAEKTYVDAANPNPCVVVDVFCVE